MLFRSPMNRILNDQQRLDEIVMRMERNFIHQLMLYKSNIGSLVARLNSVNPLNVLQRGFAIVSDSKGNIISRAALVKEGDSISVRMADGKLETEVKNIDLE